MFWLHRHTATTACSSPERRDQLLRSGWTLCTDPTHQHHLAVS